MMPVLLVHLVACIIKKLFTVDANGDSHGSNSNNACPNA